MKKIVLFSFSLFLFASCMKNDVLKQDATGNFRESEFYSSGAFDNEFELAITDTVITAVQTPDGKWQCRPMFEIQLEEAFRKKLNAEWNGVYQLKVTRPTNPNNSLDFESTNYTEKFLVTSMPSVPCGDGVGFSVKLLLVTPSTSVIATSENNYTMPTFR